MSWSTSSNWLYIFSAIILAEYCLMAPSGNMTSYTSVSKIGFSQPTPLSLPVDSNDLFITLAACICSPF